MLPGRLQSVWTLAQICPQSDARSMHSPLPVEGAVAEIPTSQEIIAVAAFMAGNDNLSN